MEQVYRNYTNAVIFLLIAAILLTLDRLGTLTFLRKIASPPFELAQIPVLTVKNNLTDKISFFVTLRSVEKENAELSQKLAVILAENAQLENLALENEALRNQLGFFSTQIRSIPAKILGTSRFLVVIPEAENLKNGLIATYGNNFVGVLIEVGTKLVKIRLPQDPASIIPAVVRTPAGSVYGNLVGRYGRTMVLEKIEKQEIIPEGSIVQTAGDENILPGLVLGKVTKVEKIDADPFLNIEVESLINFSKLSTVFILAE